MVDSITDMMLRHGKKITSKRLDIVNMLVDNRDKHLSIEDILNIGKLKGHRLSIATVYRTMTLLEQIGVVKKHTFNEDELAGKYEICIYEKENHCHLICQHCHKIIELPAVERELIEKIVLRGVSFTCNAWDIKVFGLCETCKENEEEL